MNVNGFTSKAQAIRYLKSKGHNVCTLLAQPEANPKVAKNGKEVDVNTYPLHLAPYNLSGFNVCAMASKGCIKACLHTAGNPAYMEQKNTSRITKTLAYFKERNAFLAVLFFEMLSKYNKAKRNGEEIAFRLNATSDLPVERLKVTVDDVSISLMDYFSDVQFYDYSAITKRAIACASGKMTSNYHLTFSRKEDNDDAVLEVLKHGGNVAAVASKVVYDTALAMQYIPLFKTTWKVTDGDKHDYRPVDPLGCIVLLKEKGDAKYDNTGFLIRK